MEAVDADSDEEFVLGSDEEDFVDMAKAYKEQNLNQYRTETRSLEAEELFHSGYN